MIEKIKQIRMLAPWVNCGAGLENELSKEVTKQHVLFNVRAISIARRTDNDDVLFYLPDYKMTLAVVHLTWSGKTDENPLFPYTNFFASLDSWIENVMKIDHQNLKID